MIARHLHALRYKPVVLALAIAYWPGDRAAVAQSFDPQAPSVLQAYLGSANGPKIDAARFGLNQILTRIASFPGLLSNPPSTGGSGNFLIISGGVGDYGFHLHVVPGWAFANVYSAGADADLAPLGNPVLLNNALLQATASFSTARDFLIGANAAAIDTQSFDLSLTGNLVAQGRLTKQGSGLLTLGGNATWSAPLAIAAGTVRGSASSLQTNIETDGTVEFAQSTNGTYGFAITGQGGLRKSGVGTLVLTGENSFGGTTRIDEGAIVLQGAGALGGGTLIVAPGATLDIAQANSARTLTGLSGSGSVLLGANRLDINSVATSTFAGTIAGSGSLGKGGAGTLTLSGANSYTGGTFITAGTLALSGSGSLNTTGQVVVNAGAQFDIEQASGTRTIGSLDGMGNVALGANGLTLGGGNADGGFGGTFSGSGTLTKTGTGTQSLSGVTAHTGTTIISQGTIVARSMSLGPEVTNNARLVFQETRTETNPNAAPVPAGTLHSDYPELYVYSGNITGTGQVVKQGSGALWLRGTNTYTGGTTVDDGVLVGNDLSLQGAIVNNSGVAFYQSGDGAYAGTMSGTGILLKYGPGNLTLTGTNAHAGGTAFSGPLTISDDRNLGAENASVIISGGTLRTTANIRSARRFGLGPDGGTFDTQNHTLTLSGSISGAGGLTKLGAGRLVLTAANTYTGATTVSAGTLQVDGSISSDVSVAAGASIAGSGSIQGSLLLTNGASMQIRADSTGILDRLQISSVQIQNAHLVIEAAPNPPGRSTRAILTTANGVSGQFAQVTTNLALLNPVVSYDANNVYLSLVRNDLRYQSLAQSEAQFGIASSFDRLVQAGNSDATAAAVFIDALPAPGVRAAYDSIAGVGRAQLSLVQQSGFRALTQQAGARLSLAELQRDDTPRPGFDAVRLAFDQRVLTDAPSVYAAASSPSIAQTHDARDQGFWLRGYGGNGRVDGSSGTSGTHFAFAGVLAGYDRALTDALRLGILASYSKPRLNQPDPASHTEAIARQVAMYGRYREGPFRIDGLANWGVNTVEARRSIIAGGLVRTATAAYDGRSTGIHLEAAYAMPFDEWMLEPIAGVAWQRQRYDAYAEAGAGVFNLAESERSNHSLRSSLGVRGVRNWGWRGFEIQGEVRGAWFHEFRNPSDAVVRLAADVSGAAFAVPGVHMATDSAAVGGGLAVKANRALDVFVDFNTERSARQHSNTIAAGLRYRW